MARHSFGILIAFLALLCAALVAVAVSTRPKADFTFCNSADVESLDPAKAADSSAHRVLNGIFEGLSVLHPATLVPQPGVADNVIRDANGDWQCLTDDGLQCVFHIREDARWSDGTPVTAHDFVYSFRRVLDPQTAAPYPHLLGDYVVNAEKYNSPRLLESGDAVEVELLLADGVEDTDNLRGELLGGTLFDVAEGIFAVEIAGQLRHFTTAPQTSADQQETPVEICRQVLLDFSEVGIRAVDDHNLEIFLIRPNPAFLQVLAHVTLSPVKQTYLETFGNEWTSVDHLVGNGAYVVSERRLRDRMRLQKNPHYWDRDDVGCDVIDALTVESPSTMLNLYEAGQVDWIPSVPTALVGDLERLRSEALRSAPAFSTYFYVFNVREPPFNDVHLRRALCQSVNRREIVETVLRGGQMPASSFVPHGIAGYTSPVAVTEDNASARAELALVAADKLAQFNSGNWALLYNTGDTHRAIAELVQSQWNEGLGVNIGLENREFGAFRSSVARGEFDIARSGWTGDVSDPIAFLHMFASDSPFNDAGWSNAEYDQLLAAAGTEHDAARRLEMLAQAEQILLRECPVLPLYHRVSHHLVRPEVEGFFANASDIHPLRWIRSPH